MTSERPDKPEEHIEDLEVDPQDTAEVVGGDAQYTTVSSVMKTKHDTVKNSINNVR
jgi:hypothetical protein